MAPRRTPWVTRVGPDEFALHLPRGLPEVLGELRDELDALLATDEPAVRRLFPPAYPDDPDREAGYQVLIRGELIDGHRAGLDLVATTAGSETLSAEELDVWMRTVNAIRLVLGTVLDVDEEDRDVDDDDPRAPVHRLYQVLSALLHHIVDALGS